MNVLAGGAAVGEALVAHAGVAVVSFTGSTSTGQQVAALAAQGHKRTLMHLGGKSAAVLLDDADMALALPSVLHSCMLHSGQTCTAQTRLLVPHSLRAEVVAALKSQCAEWKLGAPQEGTTRVGPVASAAQFSRVNNAIEAALAEGAELIAGGPGRAAGFEMGHYIAPTILGVAPEMAVARDELFGPVLCVLGYETEKDAIRMANDTLYGLSAAVWSARRGARASRGGPPARRPSAAQRRGGRSRRATGRSGRFRPRV